MGRRWAFSGVLTEEELTVNAPVTDKSAITVPYDLRGIRSINGQLVNIWNGRKTFYRTTK